MILRARPLERSWMESGIRMLLVLKRCDRDPYFEYERIYGYLQCRILLSDKFLFLPESK
jgi:hypothetical protein